jgi:7-cyano-7-deazaguanine reductase
MSQKTQPSDLESLTQLGKGGAQPSKTLETFPNRHPGRDYVVTLKTDEFTCVCPMTGQPDFAALTIQYIPDQRIVESKSLKLYLWSYRNEGVFHEHVTNVILDDLVAALQPRWCKVTSDFSVRGGISITVEAEYRAPEFSDNGSGEK